MTTSIPPEDDIRGAEAAAWSARLAEGPLAPQDEADFQAWLDADPANAEVVGEVMGAWRAVEAYAAAPELLELRKQALASAQRAHRGRSTRALMGANWPWAALAASIALVVVLASSWDLIVPTTYQTGLGERRVVALSDGSKLSLDAQTKVLVRYAFGKRQLWLERGRAKFDVAKDPLRPFTVDAAGREVVATGTSFSVELVHRQVRVVLYEGHVAVLDKTAGVAAPGAAIVVGSALTPADHALTPGHELITPEADPTGASSPAAVVASVDPVRSLSWEAGQLVFEDEPLSTAVERMNRYASTPLAIGDAGAGEVRISGVFRAGDTSSFAQGLSAAFPIQARAEAGRVVLYRTPR